MAEETKKPPEQNAPAPVKTEEKPPETKVETPPPATATGLDGMSKEALRELYKKSPELFDEIVPPKVEEKKEPPVEKKTEPPASQSAAPVMYEGTEVKIPADVPVDGESLKSRLANWKVLGFSPAQVQGQIDFEVQQYKAHVAALPKPKAPEEVAKEQDAANVAKLKADFGQEYDENMEIARQAAVQFADADLLAQMKTSNPVLVRHFLKLGKLNGIKPTPQGGAPRNGNETLDEEKSKDQQYRARYKNTPGMFPDAPKQE